MNPAREILNERINQLTGYINNGQDKRAYLNNQMRDLEQDLAQLEFARTQLQEVLQAIDPAWSINDPRNYNTQPLKDNA